MGRIATGMVCAGALGVFALFVGCAAGGGDDPVIPTQDASPTDPSQGNSQVLGDGNSSSSSSGSPTDPNGASDAGPISKKDGGAKADGGITIVDAGPPPPAAPNPGDACPTKDQILKVACGFCGTKQTICQQNPDNSLTWSVYDSCIGEHGECAAGSTGVQDCNNCGTRTVTCGASCTWAAGACSTAAGAGCVPGSWDLTTAGCPAGSTGQFRVSQCTAQCTPGGYTNSCEAPPTTIEVGPSVGSVSSTVAVLGGAIGGLSSYKCPITTISSTMRAYAYTQVHNSLAHDATVDIYNSASPGGGVANTAIVAYNSDVPPVSADQRKACLQSSNEGTTSLSGSFDLASMDGSKKIVIPAGQTITVFTNATDTASGAVKVNVKLEALTN